MCWKGGKKINVDKQTDFIALLYLKGYINFEAKLRYTFAVKCYRGALTSFVWASLGIWNKVAKAKVLMLNFPFKKTV